MASNGGISTKAASWRRNHRAWRSMAQNIGGWQLAQRQLAALAIVTLA